MKHILILVTALILLGVSLAYWPAETGEIVRTILLVVVGGVLSLTGFFATKGEPSREAVADLTAALNEANDKIAALHRDVSCLAYDLSCKTEEADSWRQRFNELSAKKHNVVRVTDLVDGHAYLIRKRVTGDGSFRRDPLEHVGWTTNDGHAKKFIDKGAHVTLERAWLFPDGRISPRSVSNESPRLTAIEDHANQEQQA